MTFTKKSDPMSDERVASLLRMLTYKRPAGTKTEAQFIARFIVPLGATPDEYGNYWLTIGDAPILWSSHTDTVHRTEGSQKVIYGDGIVTTNSGECLGADCGAGVWLMVHMIKARVPGTYVFHRAEEIGGKGSQYIATNSPDRLARIAFAVAFDRMGTTEIITHQYGGRTCSDAFAKSLNAALGMKFHPSDAGVFTDTANYSGIIPECTNIAVGYIGHHTAKESQNVLFLVNLLDHLIGADYSKLVCERNPADYHDDYGVSFLDDAPVVASADLESYVYENPAMVADFLAECGYDITDMRRYEKRRR